MQLRPRARVRRGVRRRGGRRGRGWARLPLVFAHDQDAVEPQSEHGGAAGLRTPHVNVAARSPP